MKENEQERNKKSESIHMFELQDKQEETFYSLKEGDNNNNENELLSRQLIEKEEKIKIDENLDHMSNDISNDISNDNIIEQNSEDEEDFVEQNNISLTKDYCMVFILFMSSSFNFSFLYLPFLFETFIYLFFLESISEYGMKFKYYLQIINFFYSIILLLFKIIYLSYDNGQSSIVENNKDLFLNLGLCYLFILLFYDEFFL